MANCTTCGSPLKRLPDGILKCKVCGLTYKPGQSTPLLSRYAPKSNLQITTAETEIQTFIERLLTKIVPIHADYTAQAKTNLIKTREKLRKELNAVFDGKETLDNWFTKTRRNFGLHQIDMTTIMYDSLEGLQSREAREMRANYGQALQQVQAMYRPPA